MPGESGYRDEESQETWLEHGAEVRDLTTSTPQQTANTPNEHMHNAMESDTTV